MGLPQESPYGATAADAERGAGVGTGSRAPARLDQLNAEGEGTI